MNPKGPHVHVVVYGWAFVCLCALSGPNRGHYITIVKSHGFWLLFDDDIVEVRHLQPLSGLTRLFVWRWFGFSSEQHLNPCCAENRRPGDRGVLWAYLRHLEELRVGIHPLLPVQGVTGAGSATQEEADKDSSLSPSWIPAVSIPSCSRSLFVPVPLSLPVLWFLPFSHLHLDCTLKRNLPATRWAERGSDAHTDIWYRFYVYNVTLHKLIHLGHFPVALLFVDVFVSRVDAWESQWDQTLSCHVFGFEAIFEV